MLQSGAGSFDFTDRAAGERCAIKVFYHRPAHHDRRCPVIIVLHGSDRAAAYVPHCWIVHADNMHALLLAPWLDHVTFPEAAAYNYGNVVSKVRSEWSYGLIDRLFGYVRATMGLERTSYSLFGHSAGAQFAHRYLALTDAPLADVVIAGNSGWYTLPDNDLAFPSGTGSVGANPGHIERYLSRTLIILVGAADNDPAGPGLPRYAAATRQGPTRLARGLYYFEHGRTVATKLGAKFGWQLSVAPGVGHQDEQIAIPAAELLGEYERSRP